MKKIKNYGGTFKEPEHAASSSMKFQEGAEHLQHDQIQPAALDKVNNAPPKKTIVTSRANPYRRYI